MNPHDVVNADDEQFSFWLARYSEAMRSGGAAAPQDNGTLSPDLARRLQRGLDCLRRLRRFRPPAELMTPPPARGAETPTVILPAAITLHDGVAVGQLGRFRILRTLGCGGGGIVFLALDPMLRRETAIKIPRLESLLDPGLRQRFLREARAVAGLNHPNLLTVYEAGEADGLCYIVSAYCSGGSLAEWLARQGKLPAIRVAAELVARLADAVAYIHTHGIYHRDIKPSNILLDPAGASPVPELNSTPRLGDFGLAKIQGCPSEATRSGSVLGTAPYMAPEQVEGRLRDIGAGTDVYGLGAVLYELLTGRPPFKGASNAATLEQVRLEEPARPRRLRAETPRDLETICLKCLEKDPKRRYAGATELADDLRRFLADEPIRARPPGRRNRLGKWTRRHPWPSALVIFGCLAVLALLLGNLWLHALERKHDASLAAAARQHEQGRKTIRQIEQLVRQYRYADDIGLAARLWENKRHAELAEHLGRINKPLGEDDPRGFEWYFLVGQSRSPNILSWLGHRRGPEPREAWAVAFSPDGKTLASAGDDHALRLWDSATGRERTVFSGHRALVTSLAFSPDGRWLASGSFDAAAPVKLWNPVTGAAIATLLGHAGPVDCLAFSADSKLLTTAGRDNSVRLWDLETRQQLDKLDVPTVESLVFSPDGRYLLLASDKETAFLWDRVQKKVHFQLSPHAWGHVAVAITADGKMIVTGDTVGLLRFWNTETGEMHAGNKQHTATVNCLAFAPDGKTIASASFDGTVKLWQTATGRELLTLTKSAERIRWVAFSADGTMLATAGHDGWLTIYRADKIDGVSNISAKRLTLPSSTSSERSHP